MSAHPCLTLAAEHRDLHCSLTIIRFQKPPIFMPSSPEHCKLTPIAPAPQVAVNLSVDATGRNQWTKLL